MPRLPNAGCRVAGYKAAPKSLMVVAASMGGTVAIPYILDPALAGTVAGYVSVSALGLPTTGGGLVDDEDGNASAAATVSSANIPALLVWGSLDHPESVKERAHEHFFPTHELVVIPDAPHPAYLKAPRLFNDLVVRFALGKKGQSKLSAGGAAHGAAVEL